MLWQTGNDPQGNALAGRSVMPARRFALAIDEQTSKAHRDRWRT